MTPKKLMIIGSFVVDLAMKSPALPKRGETVFGGPFSMGPGGKGSNQCIAAKRAGADVIFLTKIGRDQFAQVALDAYAAEGIDTTFVYRDEVRETGCALIMVEDVTGENAIGVSSGACQKITAHEIESLVPVMEEARVMLTQFETNMDAVWMALQLAKKKGLMTIVNPAPVQVVADEIYQYIDVITPNETEAQTLTGIWIHDPKDAAKAADVLLAKGAKHVLITLGENGVYYRSAEEEELFKGFTVKKVIDTTGAGDAFNGGLASALTEGRSMKEAIVFANAAGALSVTKNGTAPAMPFRSEIDTFIHQSFNKNIG